MSDRFSRRHGYAELPFVRPGEATQALRNHIWNLIESRLGYAVRIDNDTRFWRMRRVYAFLRWPVDNGSLEKVKHWVLDDVDNVNVNGCEWYELYDLLEFVGASFVGDQELPAWNEALAAEGVPYRFVNRQLVAITSEEDIQSVATAMAQPNKYLGVREHIATAAAALSKRPEPDIRNCVKEAILAVESAAKATTGITSGAFEPAFKEFEKRFGKLHPAMSAAVRSLYGYGSDEQGIRHAILDDADRLDAADARFMLVACSAFANYLVARAEGLP
jgi:hypothetical protein